jgi:hypothetical protein
MKLPKGIYFIKGNKPKKYIAKLPNGKNVSFGAQGYEQYKDLVPKRLGGGIYTKYNHLDRKRRDAYRKRHGAIITKSGKLAINIKYSPAWFSYHFLW